MALETHELSIGADQSSPDSARSLRYIFRRWAPWIGPLIPVLIAGYFLSGILATSSRCKSSYLR
jgi:hypothetical protein